MIQKLAWPVAAVCLAVALALPGSLLAQRFSVAVARSVLEYDPLGEAAFGGWRGSFGLRVTEAIDVVVSRGVWPRLIHPNPQVDGGGHDALIEIRAFPLGRKVVTPFIAFTVGTFRGLKDPRPDPSIFFANGRSTGFGLGLNLRVFPLANVQLSALRRDDAGAANLEARVGVEFWTGKQTSSAGSPGSVTVALGPVLRLGGVYKGDGLATTVDLRRMMRAGIFGNVSLGLVPVRVSEGGNGSFLLDTSVILAGLQVGHATTLGTTATASIAAGPQVASFQEGPDNGVSLGGSAEAGLRLALSRNLGAEFGLRANVFASEAPGLPTLLAPRVGLVVRW